MFIRYANLINLRQIISVEMTNQTTLRFIYPLSNYFSGSAGWHCDGSDTYKVTTVPDAAKELDRIEKLMKQADK